MLSRHIGQLAVSRSSQTTNARFSSSRRNTKPKISRNTKVQIHEILKIQIQETNWWWAGHTAHACFSSSLKIQNSLYYWAASILGEPHTISLSLERCQQRKRIKRSSSSRELLVLLGRFISSGWHPDKGLGGKLPLLTRSNHFLSHASINFHHPLSSI